MKLRFVLTSILAISALAEGQQLQTIASSNSAAPAEFTADNFLCDARVAAAMNQIHKRTMLDKTERGMTVERTGLRISPDDNRHTGATVFMTAETLAGIHTHPIDMRPEPSDIDKDAARLHQVPIYVLTLRGLFVAMPDGRVKYVSKYNGKRLAICGK